MNSWTAVNIPAGWSEVWKGRMENWGQGFLEKWHTFRPLEKAQNVKVFDSYDNVHQRTHTLFTKEALTSSLDIVTWPVDITQSPSLSALVPAQWTHEECSHGGYTWALDHGLSPTNANLVTDPAECPNCQWRDQSWTLAQHCSLTSSISFLVDCIGRFHSERNNDSFWLYLRRALGMGLTFMPAEPCLDPLRTYRVFYLLTHNTE